MSVKTLLNILTFLCVSTSVGFAMEGDDVPGRGPKRKAMQGTQEERSVRRRTDDTDERECLCGGGGGGVNPCPIHGQAAPRSAEVSWDTPAPGAALWVLPTFTEEELQPIEAIGNGASVGGGSSARGLAEFPDELLRLIIPYLQTDKRYDGEPLSRAALRATSRMFKELSDLNVTWLAVTCAGIPGGLDGVRAAIDIRKKKLRTLVLRELTISREEDIAALVATLQTCEALKELVICDATISVRLLELVVSCCPTLEILRLETVKGMWQHPGLASKQLKVVEFIDTYCSYDNASLQAFLAGCPNLEKLNFGTKGTCNLADPRLLPKELKALVVPRMTAVTSAWMNTLFAHCTELEALTVKYATLAENIGILGDLSLKKLELIEITFANDEVLNALLARCPSLQELNLSESSGLENPRIYEKTSLTWLDVEKTSIIPDCINLILQNCVALQGLFIGSISIPDDAGYQRLDYVDFSFTLPKLQYLGLGFCDIGDVELETLVMRHKQLKWLRLSECTMLENPVIASNSLKHLIFHSFAYEDDVTDECVQEAVKRCPALEILELVDCHCFENPDIVSDSLQELVIDGELAENHEWRALVQQSCPNAQILQ